MTDILQINDPGIYSWMTEEQYHADPCRVPSLSSSIAKVMLAQSPRHAWFNHPRLNPTFKRKNKAAFDLGSAAHALMLGSSEKFVRVQADSWRTKDAKAERDDAYASDLIPLLEKDWQSVEAMVAAGRQQLAMHKDASEIFSGGKAEQVLIWEENGVWCRAMLDWLKHKPTNMYGEYKTSAQSAHPELFCRTFYNLGYDVQLAFYSRGIKAVMGIENPIFEVVAQETTPPYALSVVSIAPPALEFANKKVEEAIKQWRWCMANGSWPGYPNRTAYLEPPIWEEKAWLEKETRDAMTREAGGDQALYKAALDWQSPHHTT